MIDTANLWIVILGLGVGSFILRFSFLGLVGSRPMPPWLLRHLRYTAVALLPALVTPQVVWPVATGGSFDTPRFAAAIVTVSVAWMTSNAIAGIVTGAATLYGLLFLLG